MSQHSNMSERELFNELSFYTLAHPDPVFLHQNAVDAFTAQLAGPDTKPIALVFALVGLYLHVEKQFTGKEVQRVHMHLAKNRRTWTSPLLPEGRGAIRVSQVLEEPAGPACDAMIGQWCASVWSAFQASRGEIAQLLANELDIR